MGIGLLGTKIGMTQIFDEAGNVIPVTLLTVGPCWVTQIKTLEKDGYSAIQIGYGRVSSQSLTQPELGHFQKSQLPPLKYLKEFRVLTTESYSVGQVIDVTSLVPGQRVNVQGKSIGKGFSGLQKRHHFSRGPMTHGSKNHREPGSIGMGTTPGRVLPGKKMAGQLGNRTTTLSNLKIIQTDPDENLVVVQGSVPGKPGNLLRLVVAD